VEIARRRGCGCEPAPRARDYVLFAEALKGLHAGAARLRAHRADLAPLMPLDPGRLTTLAHPQLT
jgi:hypothetical protein